MKKISLVILTVATVVAGAFSAPAQANELRVGMWEHDAQFFGIGGSKGKETSAAVSVDYLWESPDFLSKIRSPRPYVGALINLDGNTNFAGAGLEWQGNIANKVYAIYAFGVSVHDGTKEVPSPNFETDPVLINNLVNRKAREIEFGSAVLFRNAFGFGYEYSDTLGVEIVWEHLSHAKIFDSVNEGIDNVGIRVARKF